MNNMKSISQEELSKLFDEFPKLQQFSSQMKTIEMLKDVAREEKDLVFMKDSYESVLRLQDKLYAKILTYYTDEHEKQFNKINDIAINSQNQCRDLINNLQDDQQTNRETFNLLCAAFTKDPRKAFEMILQFIERDEKVKASDGYGNWQWGLHFPFIARLKMAWMLVFGKKTINA